MTARRSGATWLEYGDHRAAADYDLALREVWRLTTVTACIALRGGAASIVKTA